MFDKHTVETLKGSNNARLDREIIGKLYNYANLGATGTITSVTVTTPGLLTAVPTLSTGGTGTGAVLVPVLSAVSFVITALGSGYTVGDVLTFSGGTSTITAQITVNTVNGGGGITSATLSRAGAYTAIPGAPTSATGGTGTGFQFGVTWGLLSVTVSSGGTGYDSDDTLVITGANVSPAAGTLVVNNNNIAVTVPITTLKGLPSNYGVSVNPGQNCRWYVPQNSKTTSGFNVVLAPKDNSSAVAPGGIDILVYA
jgi:hypothetical protein